MRVRKTPSDSLSYTHMGPGTLNTLSKYPCMECVNEQLQTLLMEVMFYPHVIIKRNHLTTTV